MADFQEKAQQFAEDFRRLHAEINKVIVGNEYVIEQVLISLFAGGHCLLEGVPGLGKTLLISTLSKALDLSFSRIQFTPDLMPSDITGTHMLNEDSHGHRSFQFEPGPIFAHMVLADEINRATPKTQSALLEAMQEKQITAGKERFTLQPPFFVMATQNPLESEGTYPLPEAQLDRFFFKILLGLPSRGDLGEILNRTTGATVSEVAKVMNRDVINQWMTFARHVVIAEHVQDYAVRMVLATQPESEFATEKVRQYVRYGSSPRGAQALILAAKIRALLDGRFNVSYTDVENCMLPALRHRMILNFEAEADGIVSDTILHEFPKLIQRQAAAGV